MGWAGEVYAIRDRQHKLIRRTAGATELYDLVSDPLEQHNLAAERPEVVERLDAELQDIISMPHTSGADLEVPAELQEELRALGYID
jgi:hypothetical protein